MESPLQAHRKRVQPAEARVGATGRAEVMFSRQGRGQDGSDRKLESTPASRVPNSIFAQSQGVPLVSIIRVRSSKRLVKHPCHVHMIQA